MTTQTINLSESHNLDLLDAAALDAFEKASEPKVSEKQPEPAKPADGDVNAAKIRQDFLKPVLDAEREPVAADKAEQRDGQVADGSKPSTVDPIQLEPVKLPTSFKEYWAVTERPSTFYKSVRLLKTAAAPVSFAKDLLVKLTRSMTRMTMGLFRSVIKPTPDAGEVIRQQMETQRKDDIQALNQLREAVASDVAQAERTSES